MIGVDVKLDLRRLTYARGSGVNLAVRKAINKAGVPVKAAVQAATPDGGSGFLKASIKIKSKYYSKTKVWACIVGPSNSYKRVKKARKGKRRAKGVKGQSVRPARYAHFSQWGSKRNTGTKWLEQALSKSQSQYTSILTSTIKSSLPEMFAG